MEREKQSMGPNEIDRTIEIKEDEIRNVLKFLEGKKLLKSGAVDAETESEEAARLKFKEDLPNILETLKDKGFLDSATIDNESGEINIKVAHDGLNI